MATTRSEKWFVKGLIVGAVLGGALFAGVALTVGWPIGFLMVHAFVSGIVGAVLGGAVGGILGGISGLFFRKDKENSDVQQKDTRQPASAPQPSLQPQLAQEQSQGVPSSYYQDKVAASHGSAVTQR